MKKLLPFVFLFLLAGSTSCEYLTICDGKRYQVIIKSDLGNGKCYFKLQADGECLIWADRKHLEFVDSCKSYGLSQMVWRDDIKKKYGI